MCNEKPEPKTKEEALSRIREQQTTNGYPFARKDDIEVDVSSLNNRFANIKDNRNKSRLERNSNDSNKK